MGQFKFVFAIFRWLVILLTLYMFLSCTALDPQKGQSVRIMSYNTQNMFDDIKNGNEYPEFVPGGSGGWNRFLYRTRLERLASVIRDQGKLPDIVVLVEIETQKVLDDLCKDFLPAGAYPIRLLQADEGLIHLGLLSRVPVLSERSHRIWLDGESCRSIWELYFTTMGQSVPTGSFNPADPGLCSFALFANHWKSKSGGESQTEAMRRLAARTLNDRVSDLRLNWPRLDVIACGDLNEIIHASDETAIIEAGKSQGRQKSMGNGLPLSRDSPIFALGRPGGRAEIQVAAWDNRDALDCDWYSPWQENATDSNGTPGSYYYRGKWEAIDHFLLSESLRDEWGWSFGDFKVLVAPNLLDDKGAPSRWDNRTKSGYSDHVPLLLEIQKTGP